MPLKGKHNAWIKPCGQFIAVGYMGHNNYAIEFYNEKYGWEDAHEKIEEIVGSFGYPYEAMHKMGWVRLLTWSDRKSHILGGCAPNDGRLDTMNPKLTEKQKATIQDWCMSNNFKYENLFKQ